MCFKGQLETQKVGIQKRDSKIQEWAKKYKSLEERLTKLSAKDELAKKAKERLDQDDLDGAEKLYHDSLEKNLKIIAEKQKTAASDAYNLAAIKELKLEYQEASSFYEQAVELDPHNSEYLNAG